MQTFSSSSFQWHKGRGTTTLGDLGINGYFPDRFYLKSERTGETRMFEIDSEVMEQNEFFDGEATAYVSGDVRTQIWC